MKQMTQRRLQNSAWSCGYYVFALCLPLLLFTTAPSLAADTLILRDGIDHCPLGKYVEFLEDSSGKLTIDDIVLPAVAGRFVRNDKETPNFGLGDTVYWLRFRIGDQSSIAREWLLEQKFPLMRTFDLYIPAGNGSFAVSSFGGASSAVHAVLPHRNPLFNLPLSKNGDTFYIRASIGSMIAFPLEIYSREAFMKQDAAVLLGFGLYFGIMLAMALYNLYLYVFIRDRVYLYYVSYVISFVLVQMSLHGFLRHYLFPDNPILDNQVMRFVIVAAALSSLVFSRRFLKSNSYAVNLDRWLYALIIFDILLIPLDFFLPILPSLIVMDLNVLVTPLLATATGLVCYFRGYKPARYYLVARACLYTSVCVFVLDNTLARNYNFLSWYGMLPGSLLDVILLSLGLADRVSIMRREKEKAEADAIRAGSRALIGEMAAGVAHEVNNPLAGVMLCFQGIIKSKEGDPEREELINAVEGGLVKIQNTVAHLLNFSRMSETEMKPGDIGAIVGTVLTLCKYQLEKANIEVVTNLATDMPRQLLDENKMGQVLANLIFNASHAMQGGGILTITTAREGGWCQLTVSDTGEGIAPDILPRIFEPFYTTKESGKGTGLGLSISKSIVDAHGGLIVMESLPGEGATCRVSLPLEG